MDVTAGKFGVPGHAKTSDSHDKARVGTRRISKRTVILMLAVIIAAGAVAAWYIFSAPPLPPGFAGGNGRLEATEYFISTKYPGRIKEILFNEGDTVEAGQVV